MQEYFEKIKERFVKVGNIQFSSHTKPLITVEDAIEIVNQVAEEYKEPTLTVEQLLRPNPNLKELLKDAEECKNKYVGIEAYKQVARERDIAIEQLHGLGYEWGQKIDSNDGWIPVSERLPEEKGWYLITDKREDVVISFFFIDDHSFRRGYNPPAVAWRSLPAPYQPKDCNSCANHTDFDEVDNGCYMCCKGLEDNYQPKGE